MRKELKKWVYALIVVGVLIVVALGVGGYALYQGPPCQTDECFEENLVSCKRSSYIADKPETVLEYTIKGPDKGICKIDVELISIKRGSGELSGLEGLKMMCGIPKNTNILPESNLENCHGLLKEGIQEALIQRMHSQLLENIGDISLEANL